MKPDPSATPPHPDGPANEATPRLRGRTMEFDFVLEAPRETTLRPSRPAAKSAVGTAAVSSETGAAPVRPATTPAKAAAQAAERPATAPRREARAQATPPPLSRARRTTDSAAPDTAATPRETSTAMSTTTPVRRSSAPATARPATGGSVRNPSVDDFRRNAERQSREQKAVGNVLSWVGYSLLGGLLLVAVLAGFGGYTLLKMIEKQSVTVAQLDAAYTQQFATLKEEMILEANTRASEIAALKEELVNARRLAAKQQETIKALLADFEKSAKDAETYRAEMKEEFDAESGRRWKGDKDLKSLYYSLDKRLDSVESKLRH